ncbi:MAG: translation initiation factor IF-2 [Nevskiales bacterium]
MSKVTVKQLAEQVGTPVERLLTQLKEAGVSVSGASDVLGDDDRARLLNFLKGETAAVEPKRITLKRKTTSELKLSGTRGAATKTVSVEVRKRRTYVKAGSSDEEVKAQAAAAAEESRVVSGREAEEAKRRADEEMKRMAADEEARRMAERAALPPGAPGGISPELEALRRRAAENTMRSRQTPSQAPRPGAPRGAVAPRSPTAPRPDKGGGRRVGGKERDRRDRDKDQQEGSLRGKRRKTQQDDLQLDTAHGFEKPVEPIKREVDIPEFITVGELASRLTIKAAEVIKALMKLGAMATINQNIDHDTAYLVVEELGHIPRTAKPQDAETELQAAISDVKAEAVPRPPVVTIMGHVDHGKTSLLDYIRKSRVAAGEAGGITQHIGAYHVTTPKGVITFLDTPGHAAFTKMRARGAKATDIVILVCAADDSVMPQTKEAIQHARAANVPMVVAVTKVDKPDANLDRVRTDLSKEGVISEEWGGDIQFANVSSVTGVGIDKLLDAILLQAEVLELKAPVDAPAQGLVIESSVEKGRGSVATVLVKSGTLRQGDTLLCGQYFGRVRALFDERGQSPKEVGPSLPVQVLGLSGVPDAGDDFIVLPDERQAREVALLRETKRRENKLAAQQAARLDQMFKMGEGVAKVLNLMIKADVQGSAEAINEALQRIPSEEVRIRVISSAIGGISESDVELALASKAIIIAFNVRAEAQARRVIQESGVDVRYYSIIYDLLNDMRDAVSGLLGTEVREQFVGYAKVREVFTSSKFGQVAGCLVTEGYVARNLPIRVLRDNVVIFEGALESLRRFKDEASRVEAGTECGIGVKNYRDVKVGDQIEVFERIEVKRKVSDAA